MAVVVALQFQQLLGMFPPTVNVPYANGYSSTIDPITGLIMTEFGALPSFLKIRLACYISRLVHEFIDMHLDDGTRIYLSQNQLDIIVAGITVFLYRADPTVSFIGYLLEFINQYHHGCDAGSPSVSEKLLACIELLNGVIRADCVITGGAPSPEAVAYTNRTLYLMVSALVDIDNVTVEVFEQTIVPIMYQFRENDFDFAVNFLCSFADRLRIQYTAALGINYNFIYNEGHRIGAIIFYVLELAGVRPDVFPDFVSLITTLYADQGAFRTAMLNAISSCGRRGRILTDAQAFTLAVSTVMVYRKESDEYNAHVANERMAFKRAIVDGVNNIAQAIAGLLPVDVADIADIDNFYVAIVNHLTASGRFAANPRVILDDVIAAQAHPYPHAVHLREYPFI